jgi:hypothetical protein
MLLIDEPGKFRGPHSRAKTLPRPPVNLQRNPLGMRHEREFGGRLATAQCIDQRTRIGDAFGGERIGQAEIDEQGNLIVEANARSGGEARRNQTIRILLLVPGDDFTGHPNASCDFVCLEARTDKFDRAARMHERTSEALGRRPGNAGEIAQPLGRPQNDRRQPGPLHRGPQSIETFAAFAGAYRRG